MTITLTAADVELTKSEEGYVSHRYWDPYGECWTIGYGTTSGAGVVEPIPEYCTEAQATTWLLEYMDRDVVPAILDVYRPANGCELGGLADLGYNAGSGVFREAPMYEALRSGDRAAIARAFMTFDRAADGLILPALYHRREADAALFLHQPTEAPSFHYDRYPRSWQPHLRTYDRLRTLEHVGKLDHAGARQLLRERALCAGYTVSVWRNAARRDPLPNGRPSWSKEHRGWMWQECHRRAQGRRVFPC